MDELNLRKTVAVVLAGGQGTRMFELTAKECKPALPFADHHRIVDFTMASLRRSRLEKVMVATQYRPESLSAHLGMVWAKAFGPAALVERQGGGTSSALGYGGTADVLRSNANELDALGTEEVLVVAADHIYAMDYRPFIRHHRSSGARLTVAAMPVPLADANRFGVVQEASGRIADFEEKPLHPKSMATAPDQALASLGIYVIDWAWLREVLRDGALLDFGHDVIPLAVQRGEAGVWTWSGYWRDVGTLSGFRLSWLDFQQPFPPCATPDVLEPLSDDRFATLSAQEPEKPGVPVNRIWRAARLESSVLMPGARLSPGARLRNVIVAPGAHVPLGLPIGHDRKEDSRWFRVAGDTTLVTAEMLARRRAEIAPVYSMYKPPRVGSFNMSRQS